ncbi:MAG: serine/threonine protein kinase [Hapalosiphonaceae cyanobacterium JJU2]|nr:MAG: serine/threonine protein kinase [Hapalosiphonaceae cyanobacterium JJU2]
MQSPISTGTVLQNRYQIIQILGQGGFGRTYLAEDNRRFNELCAIKELIPNTTDPVAWQKAQELFLREANILYQIEHHQIPKFRERFEQDQRLFLVQDYVAGKTYHTLLDERKAVGGAFTEQEVLQLMRSLLPVLEHIHSRGIIHRDISPDNIILRDLDNQPVLIDFGVVKELATRLQAANPTVPATYVGKLGYSPSEQMQTGQAYPSSDLYALAVTAIVLLSGKEPQELFDENLLTWNWQRWVSVSPHLTHILNRMLSFRPSDRFQNATQVAQALASGGQQTPLASASIPAANPGVSNVQTIPVGRPPSPGSPSTPDTPSHTIPEPASRSFLDNPLAVGLITVAVVSIAGIGSWAVVRTIRGTPSPQPTEVPTQTFPSPVVPDGSTISPTPTVTSTTNEPTIVNRRLTLDASGVTNIEGTITANQIIRYTFRGQKGQNIIALLAQESGVVLTVLGPNREPIDNSAQNATFYQGTLPVNGRYAIDLTLPPGIAESDYNLNIQLESPPQPTPTQTPTDIPTEIPTETPTDIPTEIPTETPTDIPTQTPTETPTETPTNTPFLPIPNQNPNNQPTNGTSNQ